MKIAFGAAQGLEYLHEKANPPVIYRDLKPSNILLDEDYNPKLSDFGLAKLGPGGDKFNVASCVMGTYGYCAPEYARNGELTLRSDVYSFGVVLLELISGRRVIDTTRPTDEQNLVAWAQPMFKDQKRFTELVDPFLKGAYTAKGLNQAVGVTAMCLQEEAMVRPLMADIVMALSFLTEGPPLSEFSATPSPTSNPPIPEEKPQYHPPEPVVVEAMDRRRSNVRHCKSSKSYRHGSSGAGSSKHFEGLREVTSRSSSSVHSEQSCHGNCSSRSSSMHSVDTEESSNDSGHSTPENVSNDSSFNSRQASVKSTASHKCEEQQHFHHAGSANERSNYDIENYLQLNESAHYSTSSSTYRHEESEHVFDIL